MKPFANPVSARRNKRNVRLFQTSAPVLLEADSDRVPQGDNLVKRSPEFTFTKNELLDAAVDLEKRTWPEGTQASRAALEARLEVFPSGFIYCVDSQSRQVVGLTTSMLLKVSDLAAAGTWEEITSGGTISAHTPGGNVLYIVSVGVDPNLRGMGLGTRLVNAQVALGRAWSVEAVVLCSRLPGLCEYRGTANEYLEERRKTDGLSIDVDVRFYQRNRFQSHSLKPNAMKDDPESRNFGVLMYRPISSKK